MLGGCKLMSIVLSKTKYINTMTFFHYFDMSIAVNSSIVSDIFIYSLCFYLLLKGYIICRNQY